MEQQFLLVYFSDYDGENGAIGTPIIQSLTKAEIIERTKDWSRFEFAVFDGNCVKDFTNKLNPDSPLWSKPQNS